MAVPASQAALIARIAQERASRPGIRYSRAWVGKDGDPRSLEVGAAAWELGVLGLAGAALTVAILRGFRVGVLAGRVRIVRTVYVVDPAGKSHGWIYRDEREFNLASEADRQRAIDYAQGKIDPPNVNTYTVPLGWRVEGVSTTHRLLPTVNAGGSGPDQPLLSGPFGVVRVG